ncbi:MAG: periplasmic heavy metal sensor [Candidatus Aminicenantaceae bacterium]
MKRRILPIVLAFLFIINLSALAALAYNRWFSSPASPPQETPVTLEALQEPIGLDQRQLQQMKGLRGALEDEIASILVQIQQNRQALILEMQKSEPDLTAVDKTIDEIALLQSQIEKTTVRSLMRDKELMTPSQQTRYFSMFEEHVRGMGRGQGRRVRGKRGRGWQRNQ